eukprot:c19811_g1_i5.p1 GENE.c19811_g1_i5~~c19811_g1_i5.p1  ORF type:complete len:317 (+),score=68.29 c19811_g1_i5:137-952(+)
MFQRLNVFPSDRVIAKGSIDHLKRLMKLVKPHILWISGHMDYQIGSSQPTLAATHGDSVQLFDLESIVRVISQETRSKGGRLEKVVLNTCDGLGEYTCPKTGQKLPRLGNLLHLAGVPFVAGFKTAVEENAAMRFAEGMLRGLQACKGYQESFECGTEHILAEFAGVMSPAQTRKSASTLVQKFVIADPKDRQLIVQPDEVFCKMCAKGAAPCVRLQGDNGIHCQTLRDRGDILDTKWLGRVRPGQPNEGRLAAGIPELLTPTTLSSRNNL